MKNFRIMLAALLASAGCNPSGGGLGTDPVGPGKEADLHGEIVLGDRLEDPYSVENINKAITKLYGDRVEVTPTDLYVRVLPRNDADMDILESLGVQMLDHPLDYQIVREGDWYHDPSVHRDSITWQYAVVPTDFVCPDSIRFEVLDEVFLEEHSESTKAFSGIDWNLVEREAFVLTGNASMLGPFSKGGGSGTPQGRVTVLDPDYDTEPVGVAGVKVSCNVFVKFARAFTDDAGYYSMGTSFNAEPRYRIEFSNKKGFHIGFNFILVKSSVSNFGKHDASGYNFEVTPDSDRKLFMRCAVNNAAFDYVSSCSKGSTRITAPPSNLRIWIMHDLSRSCAPMFQQGTTVDGGILYEYLGSYAELLKLFFPDVIVGAKGAQSYADIYHLAVHEMAHTSHYMAVGNDYWNRYIKFIMMSYVTSGGIVYGVGTEANAGTAAVGEMWAYYIESLMHGERYPEMPSSFGYSYWFHPGIFTYLDARGLDRYKIFCALKQDVDSVQKLKDRLLSLYPECKSTINEAFSRYQQ